VADLRLGEDEVRVGERPVRGFCDLALSAETCWQQGAATAATVGAAGRSCNLSAMSAMASMSSRLAAMMASDMVAGNLFRNIH
jgi:hypothetical protein